METRNERSSLVVGSPGNSGGMLLVFFGTTRARGVERRRCNLVPAEDLDTCSRLGVCAGVPSSFCDTLRREFCVRFFEKTVELSLGSTLRARCVVVLS